MEKRWKIVVDPSKLVKGSFRVTFRAKGKRVFLHAFADTKNNIVYVESPIEDSGVRARLIRHCKLQ